MTTVVTSSMTLANVPRYSNDDQQVPDSKSVVVPMNAGRVSTTTKPSIPNFPDFSSLLLDAQNSALNTPELIQSLEDPFISGAQQDNDNAVSYMDAANPWGGNNDGLDTASIYYDAAYTLDDPDTKPILDAKGHVISNISSETGKFRTSTESSYSTFSTHSSSMVNPNPSDLTSLEPMRPTTLDLVNPSRAQSFVTSTGVSPVSSTASPLSLEEQQPIDLMTDPCYEEYQSFCQKHGLNTDLQKWTESDVQKWLKACCSRNYLSDVEINMEGVDGMRLSTFTKDDFVRRSNEVIGECLYIDMDWLKQASRSPMEPNAPRYIDMDWLKQASRSPMEPYAPTTYTDLDAVTSMISQSINNTNSSCLYTTTTNNTSSSFSSSSSLSSSPVTSPMMMAPDIPTPVMDDLDFTKSTLYQLNSEVEQHNQQQHHQHQQQQQQQQYNYANASSIWAGEMGGGAGDSSLTNSNTMLSSSCESSTLSNSLDFTTSSTSAQTMQFKQEPLDEMESEDDEEEVGPGGVRRPYVSHSKHTIHLWQFLRDLLLNPDRHSESIKWLDHSKGIFKIENSREVAKLWGQRKNRPAMNYDKLSRSIRQYYKKGIIKKTSTSKRLVYQFQPTYL